MNDFLQEVVRAGTGRCAVALGVPVGGKTEPLKNTRMPGLWDLQLIIPVVYGLGMIKERPWGKEKQEVRLPVLSGLA